MLKVVKEHYLRDDIACGCPRCPACPPSSSSASLRADAPCYAIVDTNIVIHSIDALTGPGFRDLIFLETVLDETKHLNGRVLTINLPLWSLHLFYLVPMCFVLQIRRTSAREP